MIVADAAFWVPVIRSIEVGQDSALIELSTKQPSTVTLKVRDLEGEPIEGALVSAVEWRACHRPG
ncbi:MAG: hypothetical protein M2R45_05330 [Verrucomicrobia subdivision 3 bacterium]|nr:hypothetical protein [Limisphaerales bacterium]MCS1414951.1 hypothetical protein [Limisphaerales bacterium]